MAQYKTITHAAAMLAAGPAPRRVGKVAELAAPYGGPSELTPEAQADPYGTLAKMVMSDGAPRGDELPDRVSIESKNPHYDEIVWNLGVKIDGIDQDSVVEYSVSGRWARIGERGHDGKLIWEYDHYRARKVEDVTVEPYWRRPMSRQQRRAREARARKAK